MLFFPRFLFWLSVLVCAALPVQAADTDDRAHARALRVAVVNSYGHDLTDRYYGESLRRIREAVAAFASKPWA